MCTSVYKLKSKYNKLNDKLNTNERNKNETQTTGSKKEILRREKKVIIQYKNDPTRKMCEISDI